VGTDVNGPNIVVEVHAHGMGGDKQIVGNTPNEFTSRIKFDQRVLAAMEDVDVSLGADSDAGDFNKILACGELEKIRNNYVVDIRSGCCGILSRRKREES